MRFFLPSDIYVEKNCVLNHKKDILAMGKRAFIVTGRHSAKANGSLDDVLSILKEGHVAYEIFSEVEENPSVETVAKAASMGKAFGADYLIGIGGGSPIDASKAISLLMANPEETEECLYNAKDLSYLPILAIPTTCGTGTEATPVSVLTNHQKGIKKSIPYKIFPKLSLVDGKYLKAASKNLLINTAVDALAHSVESYLNSKSNIYNRMFPEYALKLWGDQKKLLLEEGPLTDDQYEMLMLASTISGMAITHTGTGLPHGMSYDLTYNYGVPHGKACGYFLPAFLEVCSRYVPEDVDHVLALLGMKDVAEFSAFLKDLLGDYSITQEARDKFVGAMATNEGKLSAFPGPVKAEEVAYMYDASLKIEG
ncbi:MAG: iron-containing alcohol dehydrogenase family protein [Eubacteriales bacterium]|nr:iron-containing alcohol dehydrogenase family protein [Eubacteriales bacterium]